MQPTPPTLHHELRRLATGKAKTTVIWRYDKPRIHELDHHRAVIFYEHAKCGAGLIVIGLGSRKGSKSKVLQWCRDGKVRCN